MERDNDMKFRLLKEDYTRTRPAKVLAITRKTQRKFKGLAAAVLMLAAFHAKAEDSSASASLVSAPIQTRKEVKHNFNKVDFALYGGVAAYHALDYWSTERTIAAGGHEVELPKSLVASKPGFAAYEVGMSALQIGGSVMLHKHGHKKLARFADAVSISAGFATDGRNIQQYGVQQAKNAARGVKR
jgi:hypothetical protein